MIKKTLIAIFLSFAAVTVTAAPARQVVKVTSIVKVDSANVAVADSAATDSAAAMKAADQVLTDDATKVITIESGTAKVTDKDEDPWYEDSIIGILALVFGIPCLTIIAVLCLLTNYLMRRSRMRNKLIEHAIDAGYQLPEAFYTGQSNEMNPNAPSASGEEATNGRLKPSQRDQHKFRNAVIFLGVGLAIMISLFIEGSISAGFFLGGIPLFIGVGQLIGYFFVPGYSSYNNPAGPRPWEQAPYGRDYHNRPNGMPPCPPRQH